MKMLMWLGKDVSDLEDFVQIHEVIFPNFSNCLDRIERHLPQQ